MLNYTLVKLFSFKLPSLTSTSSYTSLNYQMPVVSDLTKGNELISKGKYAQAIECFDECVRIFENINQRNNIQYYFAKEKKAFCLFKQSSIDLCEKELNEVILLSKRYFRSQVIHAYSNYISFLSFFNISKANQVLDDALNETISQQIKGYFLLERALIAFLNKESLKAIDISRKIMKEWNNDNYLCALNSHNYAIITKNPNFLRRAYGAFCSITNKRHNINYGLTIIELCKQYKNKADNINTYFNDGFIYFNDKNRSDPSVGMFFNLLAKRYEEQYMVLYTEGLYQNALSQFKPNLSPIEKYNHLNIKMAYGTFLLSQKKRSEEGKILVDDSKLKLKQFPQWYSSLSSLYYLKYNIQEQILQ